MSARRHRLAAVLLLALPSLAGCKSAFIAVTVKNATGGPVRLVEIDYPSASFGTQDLAAGAEFHYRFKVIGSGPTKAQWTDASRKEHTVSGPELHEDQAGSLTVTLQPSTATWLPSLKP